MVPIIKPGKVRAGKFHPINAPPKQRDSKIAVLLTAPSNVMRSDWGIAPVESKFFVNAGFPDRPKVFKAECFDIKNLLSTLYLLPIMNYLWSHGQI
jgi:hypothetical protein